jgi:site-specific recombinase XerD
LKRNGQKSNGNMPIMGRITVNGMAVQFAAKVEIKPEYWNVTAGKAIGRSIEVQEVNNILESIKATMTKIYRDLQEKESNVTPERIKNIFFGIEVKSQMVLELFKQHNDDIYKLIGVSRSTVCYNKYELTQKRLESFLKEEYHVSDISLKEINHKFITDFEAYLRGVCGYNANTTAKFIQRFKSIIIMARNNGWLHHDPFANYKIKSPKVDRGYLTQEELEAIMQKEFPIKRLEQVRDIFIFACFTGLAYIDVRNLRETNIRVSFDGNLWVMTKRQKTDVQSNIPLLDVPKQILEKYKGTLSNGAVLPVPSNQKMNAYLKEIGELCGIGKNLTFHLARHTFATTTTLAKGVPIETVSKMLGHTNIKTTQIYARITDNKISHDMTVLAKKLESKKSKSKLDQLFECLSLSEKMTLFNLPRTLSSDSDREKRMSIIWQSLSDEEKASLWEKTFENETSFFFNEENIDYKYAVTQ